MHHSELERELMNVVAGGADFSIRRRAEYSADASNYRRVPLGVVFPADEGEVVSAVAACRDAGVPVTMRGGGTSVAGNAIGDGIVIDCSRHLDQVRGIDPDNCTANVQPGVVLDDLQRAASQFGLRFGPDPSTHSRCTIGGMIGNNACGSRSLGYGRTSDNVVGLDVLLYDGTRMNLNHSLAEKGSHAAELDSDLQELVAQHETLIRQRMGRFRRQISGYSLEHLLPENNFDVARALVGTESTCAMVLGATLTLVRSEAAPALVVFGFDDVVTAAEVVMDILPYSPIALEGMDALTVGNRKSLMPEGDAWLLVEVPSDVAPEVVAAVRAKSHRVAIDPAEQRALWRVREEGAGTATRLPDGGEAWPGWEDAAVPPEKLASYLLEYRKLTQRHGRRGALYGHFGEGCIHTRIDFRFEAEGDKAKFREFIEDAARLAADHGGSFSGEHGDGLARSELLPLMYGDELTGVFADFKNIWDPDGKLNPQVVVAPARIDDNLRVDPNRPRIPVSTVFDYPHDSGDFGKAVRRCVGVGKCRADQGGVMCPSFRATHDERDSTRGRARVLDEMLHGEVVKGGWKAEEARDALDLCLSCKGCKADCPVNVDMATYKSEFLFHHYKGRLRPISHYSLGWLPVWARAASRAPRLANALAPWVRRVGGVTTKRPLAKFANESFRDWFRNHDAPAGLEKEVLLWIDTFTNYMSPNVGQAAVKVLEAAGFKVVLPLDSNVCCGLTWTTTGQLGTARKKMARSLDAVSPIIRTGVPMVGLEPSCTAVFRSDITELLSDDPRAKRVSESTLTLAEFLDTHAADWELPRVEGQAACQTHCHQHAVMGAEADERVLRRLGLDLTMLDSGCCGLAGNFGYEREHFDVSMAVAGQGLLPALREVSPEGLVLSDGFSCRTQIAQLTDRSPVHLAEIIAQKL